jgi:hypothetical protein
MVIDISSFFSKITTKLLDELTRHVRYEKMGCKPMTAAMRAEVILQLSEFESYSPIPTADL